MNISAYEFQSAATAVPASIRGPLSTLAQEHAAGSPPTPIAQANVISIEDDDYSYDDDQVIKSMIMTTTEATTELLL